MLLLLIEVFTLFNRRNCKNKYCEGLLFRKSGGEKLMTVCILIIGADYGRAKKHMPPLKIFRRGTAPTAHI